MSASDHIFINILQKVKCKIRKCSSVNLGILQFVPLNDYCVKTIDSTNTDHIYFASTQATEHVSQAGLLQPKVTGVGTLKQYNIKNIYTYHHQNKQINIKSIAYSYILVRTLKTLIIRLRWFCSESKTLMHFLQRNEDKMIMEKNKDEG